MRIELDRDRCEGHGLCAEKASDVLRLDDDGYPAFDADVPAAQEPGVRAAAMACPVAALRLLT